MKIHLVRHGETDWNAEGRLQGHSPSRLSAKGREEALHLAQALPKGFTRWPVYASDLKRTVETAHLLHGGLCTHLKTSPLLREISLGHWEGKLRKEVSRSEPGLFHTFKQKASRFSIEGGETFHDVQARGLRFIAQLRQNECATDILVVSHRGLIKSVLSYYENRSLDEIWNEPTISNCSVSILEADANGVAMLQYAKVYRYQDVR